ETVAQPEAPNFNAVVRPAPSVFRCPSFTGQVPWVVQSTVVAPPDGMDVVPMISNYFACMGGGVPPTTGLASNSNACTGGRGTGTYFPASFKNGLITVNS